MNKREKVKKIILKSLNVNPKTTSFVIEEEN